MTFKRHWSFGGLVVTRLAQQPDKFAAFSRIPQGVILFTPAVVPYPFAGSDGIARINTLTHQPNPPVAGPPRPAAPAQNPLFAGRLLYEAWLAGREQLPSTTRVVQGASLVTTDDTICRGRPFCGAPY
jgi:hypothetical protein